MSRIHLLKVRVKLLKYGQPTTAIDTASIIRFIFAIPGENRRIIGEHLDDTKLVQR